MNLLKILNLIRLNGGVTYNLSTGETNPDDGYMVSLEKHGFVSHFVAPDIVRDYLKEKAHLLTQSNRYFGVWNNGTDYVFDVSEKVDSLEVALFLGRQRKQLAIWDNVHKDEIKIGYEKSI